MVDVTGHRTGVDSIIEQYKPEARKILENAADPLTSGTSCVERVLGHKFCFMGIVITDQIAGAVLPTITWEYLHTFVALDTRQ
jgi:hypothetical protein